MMWRTFFSMGVVLSLAVASAYASGAAARQKTGVRATRQIRVNPTPAAPAGRTEATDDRKPKESTSAPVSKPVVSAPAPQVLVSSPFYQEQQPSRVSSPGSSGEISPGLEADLARLFALLEQSSEIWLGIEDMRIKMLVVSRYIDMFKERGAIIRKPALYYVNLINAMVQDDSGMLRRPFEDILRTIAIVEYDFNNGQNKDILAKQILGTEAFVANKRRLGLQ